VRTTAARLSPSGIAYVVPSAARRLRRALDSAGIGGDETLLHIPSVPDGRHLVPLGTAAERYALSGQLPMSELKRRAAGAALRLPRLAELGPTGAVHRRSRAAALGQWLFELGEQRLAPGSLLVGMSGAGDAAVVHRFPASRSRADAVAKISPRARRELYALREIAPGAGVAGARVPGVLAAGELGSLPFVLQSALSGRNAALLVQRRKVSARRVQEELADWLDRWARATATTRVLGPDHLERFVLGPAAELGHRLPASYLERLRRLCARAAGKTCPVVPCHGDLTLANVMLDYEGSLGVVDWEHAVGDSLPLLDFFYSAADSVAAENAYADRVEAMASCFASDGVHASVVGMLLRRLAAALSIDRTVQEFCFHACWLHHSANETRRSPAYPGPFMAILRMIAADDRRFSLPDSTR
jgi:aminoglycoside phosphotransferase